MGMYSITPIGSSTAGASRVANAYVDYLENGQPMRGLAKQHNLDGTVSYYADSIEGPAMWSGHGAARLELFGQVDPEDLKSILEGRHHQTGERLTSARGSAGRYGLKVGEPTRLIHDRAVWSPHDLGRRFDLDETAFHELTNHLSLVPIEVDGELYFPASAVTSLTDELDDHDVKHALEQGESDDLFTTREAAELIGVTPRYIRTVITHHQTLLDDRQPIDDRANDWLPATKTKVAGRQQWLIRRGDLLAFNQRRDPPSVRLAYDVTFSIEKSVSVLGLLSTGAVRDVVTQALVDGNAAGLTYLEQHASDGRARGESIGSEGLTAATYIHATSRNNDPLLHLHNVIANVLEDENGIGRAIDARKMYEHAPAAAALASEHVRWTLNQQLGVEFETTKTGVEIVGINKAIRDVFSSRTEEVEDLVGNIEATAKERQLAATKTRADKTVATIDELFDTWWSKAHDAGLTTETLETVTNPNRRYSPELSRSERAEVMAHLGGANGATSRRSVFTYSDVVRAIGDWTPKDANGRVRVMPAVEAKRMADQFITSSMVVPLNVDKRQVSVTAGKITSTLADGEVFSTRRMLAIHRRTVDRWMNGLDGGAAVTPQQLDAVLKEHSALTDHQRDFVTHWVTSGHQFQSGIGVPGAGKTFTMTAARDAWETSGYHVIGAAIKGTAARELAAVGIDSYTLASLFTAEAMNQSKLTDKTVLIVDEASTVGDEDLHDLLSIAADAGTTVRFLGDTKQHQSVPAGGMWTHLVRTFATSTPQLDESFRLKDLPVDLQANQALRDGDVERAFKVLAQAGQLHEVPTPTDGYHALLNRALEIREGGDTSPMIFRTNHGRQILNDAMQQLRIDRGDVTNVRAYARHRFGTGDQVIARSKATNLHPDGECDSHIRNGSTGTISDITNENVVVDFDGLGVIDIPHDAINWPTRSGEDLLQLGYAITSYSVQGKTLRESISGIGFGATMAEVLVNISRGDKLNELFVIGQGDSELAGFQEPNTATLTKQIEASIRDGDIAPAGIVDETALDRDMNLARVHAIGAEGHDHIVAVEAAQRRAIIAHPPADLVAFLPEKPTTPHLRQRWENAVVTGGLYAAQYVPRTNATSPWGRTLGSPPAPDTNPKQREHYDQAVKRLVEAATIITLRNLQNEAITPDRAIDTPLPELPTPPSQQTPDPAVIRRDAQRLDRLNTTLIADIEHDLQRIPPEQANVAVALNYRLTELDRIQTVNRELIDLLNNGNFDVIHANQLVDQTLAHTQRAVHRAHRRLDKLADQHRKAHPTVIKRVHQEIKIHTEQRDLVQSLQDNLREIHANQPNPIVVDRDDTISHQTLTNPHSWLTDHITELAANNQITPATNSRRLAEWAGQAAIYKERWNADPLSAAPIVSPWQANERGALDDLKASALTPSVVDIDLAQPSVERELDLGVGI